MEFASWLTLVAWLSLAVALACAVVIAADLFRRPQHMWIMNVVWPVTALYAGPLAVWAYYRYGTLSSKPSVMRAKGRGEEDPGKSKPFPAIVAVGATHCGAGCTLGDLIAEWAIVLFPVLGTFLFDTKIFNGWIVSYVLAYLLGVAFQYFTIAPMRGLGLGGGLWAAVKADTLSLTAWQVGMYGWMAVVTFAIFGREIPKTTAVFWFMMQVAMLCGFVTSYPVNWWLIRAGLKERM